MSDAHEEIVKAEDDSSHDHHEHHETVAKEKDESHEGLKDLNEAVGNLSLEGKSSNDEEEKTLHEKDDEEHHSKKTHEGKKHEEIEEDSHEDSSRDQQVHSPEIHHSEKSEHHESHGEHRKELHPSDTHEDHHQHEAPVKLLEDDLKIDELNAENPEHDDLEETAHPDTLKTYENLLKLDIDEENEFLIPFQAKLKKEGKFHETLLGNYLKISGDFISTDLLHINGKDLKVNKFNWTSRSLQIGKDFLLFTGGNSSYNSVFVLDVNDGELKEIAKLHHARDMHAMAWIDGKVAVIGGCDGDQKALTSVEVFDSNSWTSVSPLNSARYGHSATFHLGFTWVFGGANGKNSPVQTVEVFKNNIWKELKVKSPLEVVGAGIIGVKNSIFILGGFTINKANSSAVFKFDVKEETFEQVEDLDEPASFSQNLWRLDGDYIEGFRFRGKRITYKP
jgi:hypothetical protein